MKVNFISSIDRSRYLAFLQFSFIIAIIFSSLFCALLCTIFTGFDISLAELTQLFIDTLAVSWLFILGIKVLFVLLLRAIQSVIYLLTLVAPEKLSMRNFLVATCLAGLALSSCNTPPLAGISKDLNTGMVTTYSQLKPENTVLVMNEEKLGHTQIPLGEKFIIINEHVKGLTPKDNKVSIGCSLTITDTAGKELLNEPDLFKNEGGIYDIKDAEYLRCTVSTGKPMDFDKDYKVAVRFWDKYGKGSIENKLTISIIDIP